MRRRDFITLVGGAAAAWPLAARAQQPGPMRRIAVLMPNAEDDPMAQPRVTGLQQSLAKLGWVVGRNIRIDYRWNASDADRVQAIVAELMAQPIDVILTSLSAAVVALQRATHTVPVVFVGISEPVEKGFVQSLAHPGGN